MILFHASVSVKDNRKIRVGVRIVDGANAVERNVDRNVRDLVDSVVAKFVQRDAHDTEQHDDKIEETLSTISVSSSASISLLRSAGFSTKSD